MKTMRVVLTPVTKRPVHRILRNPSLRDFELFRAHTIGIGGRRISKSETTWRTDCMKNWRGCILQIPGSIVLNSFPAGLQKDRVAARP